MTVVVEQTSNLRGELRYDEPLAGYTSWRVGGLARRFYRPADLADLSEFLRSLATDEPLLWLGLGSNLLVRDGGFPGTVLLIHGSLQGLSSIADDVIRVEAGVPCAKVARFCARQNRVGAEFMAGIPGTMGGALAMNAGAWGGETWRQVTVVETMDRTGIVHRRPPQDFEIGYRHVVGPAGEWFVAAHLQLQAGDGQASLANTRQLLEQRNRSQPTGVASCGSVFRNPAGDYAARLIESAGLKGYAIGAACVSTKHANFIINTGDATAAQLEDLIDYVAAQVKAIHGISLVPEVRIIGERTNVRT